MIALSPIDGERFGVVIARDAEVADATVALDLEFCRGNAVRMLIARCRTDDLAAAQALEAAGGRIMDTLLYFSRPVAGVDLPETRCPVPVRRVRPRDEEGVRAVAAEAFHGYRGHYHADPRLDPALCDEGYRSWAERACLQRDVAGEVFVADDGTVAGFGTLRLNDPTEGEGGLYAVARRAQGAGVYRALMVESLRWCQEQGAERMIISTQVTNLASQKVWSRLGFEPFRSYYTFHLWFDGK
ncbi:MAG: GNAT family N-acetyltransferase [Anaeromyxobacteraceae bacterium]